MIGDGQKFKDGSSTGRSIYDSYRLYETHSDNGGTTWSEFSDLEGILSTPVTFKSENGSLYVYAFGWDLTDPNNPKSGYDTNSRVNIYSRKETNGSFSPWETVGPFDPRYQAAQDPRYYRKNTLNTSGVQLSASVTEDGKLKITRIFQGSNTTQPTATPTPRSQSSLPQATPTRIPGLNSACLNGSMYQKTTGRCSNNLGCTAVYFNTSAGGQNSCTNSPVGAVVYVNDKTNCRIITQDEKRQRNMDTNDDSVNSPCYVDAMDPVGKTQLDCVHQNVNNPTNIKNCFSTTTNPNVSHSPQATATPTPVSGSKPNPTVTPTPVKTGSSNCPDMSKLRLVTRCSNIYACSAATFYTLDPVSTPLANTKPYTGPLCNVYGDKTGDAKIDYTSGARSPSIRCTDTTYQGKALPHLSETYNGGQCDYCSSADSCPKFTGPSRTPGIGE